MNINRRKLRASLGTRRLRRAGTKTKAIPGSGSGVNQKVQNYRHYRRQRPRPATLLKALIRKAQAEQTTQVAA